MCRALDTFDSVLNGHILYFYLVKNYLNPLAVYAPTWYVVLVAGMFIYSSSRDLGVLL